MTDNEIAPLPEPGLPVSDFHLDAQPSLPPAEMALKFIGRNREFRQLVTKGALYELITFGFYRFWLATAMRRHLWGNTTLDGDPIEYTGNARELLIGFLFALAILAPLYLGYFLLGLEVERYQAFASVPLALALFMFGQFAIYRARRYRLNRTLWRGVRMWMTGSGWKYAFRAFFWDILTALTLGLALPWRNAALERYKMQNTHYGSLQGSFVGTGGQLFKAGWWLWLASIAAVLVFYTPVIIAWIALQSQEPSNATSFLLLPIVSAMSMPFIYGAFKAIEWKWWLEGVRIGEVQATCNPKSLQFMSNTWKLIGLSIPIMMLYGFIVSMMIGWLVSHPSWRDVLMTPKSSAGGTVYQGGIVVNVVVYLIMMLMFGIVLRIYQQQRVWQMVVNSVTLSKTQTLSGVEAKGDVVNALGEGFADSLDIVGF